MNLHYPPQSFNGAKILPTITLFISSFVNIAHLINTSYLPHLLNNLQ